MKNKVIAFALSLVLFAGILCVPQTSINAAENVIGNQSQNEGIFAVPTPGDVTIDGKFDDWDWSGRILTFGDYERMDMESAESAYMYDSEYLYIGFKFTDLTPLNNPINPEIEPSWTWRGDCNQFRIITDGVPIWVTVAYYEPNKVSSMFFEYWGSEISSTNSSTVAYLTERGGTKLNKTILGDKAPSNIDISGEICFVKDEDGKGYSYELKIPWKVLYNDPGKVVPGAVFQFGIECKFTNNGNSGNFSNTAYDNHQPGDTTSSFFYTAKDAWGDMTLSPKGGLETRQYLADTASDSNGSIHISAKVPKNSKYITVVADDKNGKRVANIASELAITEKNIIAEDETSYTIDITWDGKGLLGDYVTPGEYVISGITHEGLKVYFDYTAYNPGTPAWVTSDGRGSFGSDHYPPEAVASYGKETYIGYSASESGFGIISIDENGKKQWGNKRGGRFLAATEKYIYAIPGSDFYSINATTGDIYILRLERETGTITPFTLNGEARKTELLLSTILGINQSVLPKTVGLAAYENTVAIATAANNTDATVSAGTLKNYVSGVSLLDGESALLKKKIYIPDVGQITYSDNGTLYAVSGENQIVEVDCKKGSYKVLPIKNTEKSAFSAIACDKNGNVLVFDKTEDKQIKAFNPKTGELVYTVGKKGGRALMGDFDNTGFTHKVTSISVDGYNHIWAAELWEYPRRVSVWNTDGTVFKDYIGTAGYMSAGATMHDTDPTKFYVGANEIEIDHENKTWEVKKILWVPDISKGQAYPISTTAFNLMQHFSREYQGKKREFIFGQSNSANVLYAEKDDGSFAPVFAIGKVGDLNVSRASTADYAAYYDTILIESEVTNLARAGFDAFKGVDDESFYIWNDLNGDTAIDYNECEFVYGYSYNDRFGSHSTDFPIKTGWGNRMTSDMRFVLSNESNECFMFTPDYFTEDGIPRYSKKSMKYLSGASVYTYEALLLEGSNKVLTFRNDGGLTPDAEKSGLKLIDYDLNSETVWWYDNPYPGVHGSHTAPVPKDGEIVGPIKMLGIINVEGEEIFAIRGNLGSDFFMTTDGYYIQTVLKDSRKSYISLPDQDMDMTNFDMTNSSEVGEPFSGSLSYHDDGVVRMSVSTGGPTAVVTRIEGLEKINRIDGFKFNLTMNDINEAKIYNDQLESLNTTVSIGSSAAKSSLVVNKVDSSAITVDGDMVEWGELEGIKLSKSGAYENGDIKLAYDDENLYGMFMINDKSPMANSGTDYTQLFKTGDAVDICLSPIRSTSEAGMGDMRIVISNYRGEPTAVMMKKKDYNDKNSFDYASPIKSVKFDNVSILKSAEVKFSIAANEAYVVEFKIPFEAIDFTPKSGDVIRGDIGFITSDEGGTYNTTRIYYYNKETGLVKDLPNEADLFPQRWGNVEFR